MKKHTAGRILANAFEIRDSSGVDAGTTFTVLVVIDGIADAVPQNTVRALERGFGELMGRPDTTHKFEIKTVSVSRLTPEAVHGRVLLAVIDHASSDFWADVAIRQSIVAGLATSVFLLNRLETALIY